MRCGGGGAPACGRARAQALNISHHCQQCPLQEALGLPASGSVGERQRSKQVHRLRGEASHRSLFDVQHHWVEASSAEALSTRSMKPAWEGSGADQLVRDARGKGGAGVCVERSCDGGEARGRGAKRARAARARAHTPAYLAAPFAGRRGGAAREPRNRSRACATP